MANPQAFSSTTNTVGFTLSNSTGTINITGGTVSVTGSESFAVVNKNSAGVISIGPGATIVGAQK